MTDEEFRTAVDDELVRLEQERIVKDARGPETVSEMKARLDDPIDTANQFHETCTHQGLECEPMLVCSEGCTCKDCKAAARQLATLLAQADIETSYGDWEEDDLTPEEEYEMFRTGPLAGDDE